LRPSLPRSKETPLRANMMLPIIRGHRAGMIGTTLKKERGRSARSALVKFDCKGTEPLGEGGLVITASFDHLGILVRFASK